jgi:cyclopropane-fatty-acyl-phospholipid synthase
MIDTLLSSGLVPDVLIRQRIRSLLRARLDELDQRDPERNAERLAAFIARMDASPLALDTQTANEQHYDLPPRFFERCLGPNLKYSSALYGPGTRSLEEAENAMLDLTVQRAGIKNGDKILELGCGWGSLALHCAARFQKSSITAVSNSAAQKAFIDARAKVRRLKNLKVITANMLHFKAPRRYDRIVSVEMFEHMRNWRELFKRVSGWLEPRGTFFLHVFSHRRFAYPFEVRDSSDWMSRYFFTGGLMPSHNLPLYFQDRLVIKKHWAVNGTHYQRTAEDWLANMDRHRSEILALFRETYGGDKARLWFAYWRIFYMACAELWGFDQGREWGVSHYLFEQR